MKMRMGRCRSTPPAALASTGFGPSSSGTSTMPAPPVYDNGSMPSRFTGVCVTPNGKFMPLMVIAIDIRRVFVLEWDPSTLGSLGSSICGASMKSASSPIYEFQVLPAAAKSPDFWEEDEATDGYLLHYKQQGEIGASDLTRIVEHVGLTALLCEGESSN